MLGTPLARAAAAMLALATAAACGDGSDATGLRGGKSAVAGAVTLAKTGEGVPDAVVAILADGHVVDTRATDTEGEFAFPSVPAGRYALRLTGLELTGLSPRHVSFEPYEQVVDVAGEPVEVYFSGVGLIPPRISGYVLCNGQAVPDAAIRVVGGDVDQTVRTNAQGKYGATDLGAGFYTAILESAPGACDFGLRYEVVHARAGQFVDVDFTASN